MNKFFIRKIREREHIDYGILGYGDDYYEYEIPTEIEDKKNELILLIIIKDEYLDELRFKNFLLNE